MSSPQSVSVPEAARILGIGRSSMYRLLDGDTPPVRLLPGLPVKRIALVELQRYLEGSAVPESA